MVVVVVLLAVFFSNFCDFHLLIYIYFFYTFLSFCLVLFLVSNVLSSKRTKINYVDDVK